MEVPEGFGSITIRSEVEGVLEFACFCFGPIQGMHRREQPLQSTLLAPDAEIPVLCPKEAGSGHLSCICKLKTAGFTLAEIQLQSPFLKIEAFCHG